jgi:hypothetical protein
MEAFAGSLRGFCCTFVADNGAVCPDEIEGLATRCSQSAGSAMT